MEFKYCQIDPSTSTRDEIKVEIERLKKRAADLKSLEQAYKLVSNSIYGALGNKWLACFNPEVAEAITLQGQDLIKFAERVVNLYFNTFWHKDTELHEKLGLTSVKEVTAPVNIYSDTDSCYIKFADVLDSCDWASVVDSEGNKRYANQIDFILALNEHRLTGYLTKQFDVYAGKWNTKSHMDFELENISEAGVWLAKKKYLLNVSWQDGIELESLKHVVFKGVELAQSSTPQLARTRMMELVRHVFTKKKQFNKNELVGLLRAIKDEYRLADPDKIAKGQSINDYDKYILNDTTAFEVAGGTPMAVRAAGYYNFMLNKDPRMKGKYQLIRSGDKIKFYKSKVRNRHAEEDVFAYLPGSYPYEFAPGIDYEQQFNDTVLEPINRIVVAMGHAPVLPGLQRFTDLTEGAGETVVDDFDPFDF